MGDWSLGRGDSLLVTLWVARRSLGELGGHRGHAERNVLKVTVDSSEPLEDAIRVLGALYGVTLVVAEDRQEASKPAQRATRPRKRSASTRPRIGAAVGDAGAGKSRRARAAARSMGAPSNAEVRSWARQTGLTVSERGRVPASVLTAYRNAHE